MCIGRIGRIGRAGKRLSLGTIGRIGKRQSLLAMPGWQWQCWWQWGDIFKDTTWLSYLNLKTCFRNDSACCYELPTGWRVLAIVVVMVVVASLPTVTPPTPTPLFTNQSVNRSIVIWYFRIACFRLYNFSIDNIPMSSLAKRTWTSVVLPLRLLRLLQLLQLCL